MVLGHLEFISRTHGLLPLTLPRRFMFLGNLEFISRMPRLCSRDCQRWFLVLGRLDFTLKAVKEGLCFWDTWNLFLG